MNVLELLKGKANPTMPQKTTQQVIDEFISARRVQRLSERTLEDYGLTLRRLAEFVGPDTPFDSLTVGQLRDFMAGLTHLSNKSLLNVHVGLSSLWTWSVDEGLCQEHLPHRIKPPKPEETVTPIFTAEEIKRLLKTAEGESHKERNRAILLILVDTGIRASEMAGLTVGDILGNKLRVFGKGSKERQVPLSTRTLKALLDYLAGRGRLPTKAPLFLTEGGHGMTRHGLFKIISRLGDKANVADTHPHRFRHTFAVNYLRNGGDAISLQELLGHSTLDMVKHYVKLAATDLQEIHHRASPVENWRL